MARKRIVIGISGSSGVIYGVELLRFFKERPGYETHLVMSPTGRMSIGFETDLKPKDVERLADRVHAHHDLASALSSGSFLTDGMIIAPCSMKTLSGVANSYGDNLLIRAADVTLKEGRPLILLVRETPLHLGHLRLMVQAAEIGAVILPPMPAFYPRPKTIEDLIAHTVGKTLDRLGIEHDLFRRWEGPSTE